MAICVVVDSAGSLVPVPGTASDCPGYVLPTAAEHAQVANFSELFAMPDPAEANQVFAFCFGIVLAMNVVGYVTGAVVKSISTDRA